ncbi:MAG TPA: hypothetical protein VFQ25_12085 [Ktedonobacterales bacterium]|nr:hypothetical protein [Ktedonobacterales bacterium]
MSEKPTLRELLTAKRAQSLLDDASALTPSDSAPTSAEVTTAIATLGGPEFTPAKLDLLRASLSAFDLQASTLRMTPSQAWRALSQGARRTKSKTASGTVAGALTVAGLDAMTEGDWEECARWLAEQVGYIVEERPLLRHGSLLAWRAQRAQPAGESVVLCALRLPPGAPLLDADLRHMVTIAANEPGSQLVTLTTAEATVGARLIARAANAELFDRAELERLLEGLATAHARERTQSLNDAKAQARAAAAARKKLLAALTAADKLAKAPLPPQRVTGRAAVRKAVEQAREARRQASQALLAWETLIAEWLATFGERPARDGSLSLLAEPGAWAELGARADHLKKPLLDALRALAKTAGDGDLGYGPWRQALSEELAARCAAALWRASMIDPGQWQDYASAVNDLALREASRADNAAAHASARAERAQSQMAERPGVA